MDKITRKEQIKKFIDTLAPELIKISLFLHQNPELSGKETRSTQLLQKTVEHYGFTVNQNISDYETAFIAKRGNRGPKIVFLAEYDALPNLGHACGHNLIAAMSLGAAIAFSAIADDESTVYLIGCPAEETSGAKVRLAADGIFDKLAAALIIHPHIGIGSRLVGHTPEFATAAGAAYAQQ